MAFEKLENIVRGAASGVARHGRKAAIGTAGLGLVALAYAGCSGNDNSTPPTASSPVSSTATYTPSPANAATPTAPATPTATYTPTAVPPTATPGLEYKVITADQLGAGDANRPVLPVNDPSALSGMHYDIVLTDPKYNSKGYLVLDVVPGTRLTSPIDGVISSYTFQSPVLFGTGTISYRIKASSGEIVQIFVPPGTPSLVDMGSSVSRGNEIIDYIGGHLGGEASAISVMMGYNDVRGSVVDISQQWATGSPAILEK